jgi:pimeloyl-ACP methyl ester carboxylesterase
LTVLLVVVKTSRMDLTNSKNLDAPVRIALQTPEGTVSGWRYRNDAAPPLLFAHANGFCASAYRQVLTPLAASYDVYAIDLRGHGRTTLSFDPARHRSWEVFARDIRAAIDAFSAQREFKSDWVLAGHSMGAVSALLAAPGGADVREVRLIEPVFVPDIFSLATNLPETFWKAGLRRSSMVRGALGRRRRWPSADAALQSYSAKPPFSKWASGVLSDYLEDGLCESAEGVTLSCPPEWEAANYMALANPVWSSIRRYDGRLRLLVGADGSTAPEWARRRFEKAGGLVELAEGCSHLAPMQNPARSLAFLQAD